MSSSPQRHTVPYTEFSVLHLAREILNSEGNALLGLTAKLDQQFCDAVDQLTRCRGNVVLTGIGKAGLIAQKISATLSSTGTRSSYLHPAEAVHGDLGILRAGDVLVAFSNSGETEEIIRLLPFVKSLEIPIVAITAGDTSRLGQEADIVIPMGRHKETGPHGLAPSTTTTVMLGLGDALALVVARQRGFEPQHFANWHPGGSLGLKFKTAADVMRTGSEVRMAADHQSVREVLSKLKVEGRRSGAVMLIDEESGQLSGIFTDSDLARLLEQKQDELLDAPIKNVMTNHPRTVNADLPLSTAIDLLADKKLSELPVIDDQTRPVGLLDITDLIGMLPAAQETPPLRKSA